MRKRGRLNEKIAEFIDVSRDVILDTYLIRTLGAREMAVENYKGILEYGKNMIKLKANPDNISVFGDDLELLSISDDSVCIKGEISKIEFGEK